MTLRAGNVMIGDLYYNIGFIIFLNYGRVDLLKALADFVDLLSDLN